MKIMILEDEVSLAYTLSATLEKELGSDTVVKICTTAEAALQLLKIHTFDLIVSDWRLPGISGLDFITQVRKSLPDTPIIFMTAFSSEKVEMEAKEMSNHFLSKPFEITELTSAAQRLLHLEDETDQDDLQADATRHLLVLEDDRSLLALYRKVFTKVGFTVHATETLKEADILLRDQDFDLFICDVKLDKGIGVDLLLIWRDKLVANNTKVIVVSGDSWYGLLSKKIGADYFFQKPVEMGTLVNLVNQLTKGPQVQ